MRLWKQLLFLLLFSFGATRTCGQTERGLRIEGRTMGTTYSIVYFDKRGRDFKASIDSLLKKVNEGISTYDHSSAVSTFNKNTTGSNLNSEHFARALAESLKIAKETEGNFDVTVMPLVNLWGFGPEKTGVPSAHKIDSIKKFVGYAHVGLMDDQVVKDHPNVQLDFGGIGQGYGVDVISDFLRLRGVRNFLVELGGEGFASGKNLEHNRNWTVGIINPFKPKEDQQLIGHALVEDEAFTTSGNYYNYRMIDGKKYGHTISPFTGYPVDHELISVSLFAENCITADAWDTAFLVAGKVQTLDFLERNPNLAAVLVYFEGGKPAIFISERIKSKIFLDAPYDR